VAFNGGEIIVETGIPVRVPAPFCLSPTLISWEIESFLPLFLLINYDEKSMKIPSLKNIREKVGFSVSYPCTVDPAPAEGRPGGGSIFMNIRLYHLFYSP